MSSVADQSEIAGVQWARNQNNRFATCAKISRQSVIEQERERIACEIHDSFAQLFAGIAMQLAAGRQCSESNQEAANNCLQRALELAHSGLAEVRRFALGLRSSLVEEFGLANAVRVLVERCNAPGRLSCRYLQLGSCPRRLNATVEYELFRIAQEAVGNVIRHADAGVLIVRLIYASELILEVSDDGKGLTAEQMARAEGLGLKNMRARAQRIGGRLTIKSSSGSGTTVAVRVPLR
jgi:signal transduction histidine kinase